MYCENDQILINNLQKIRTGAVIILACEKGFNYTKIQATIQQLPIPVVGAFFPGIIAQNELHYTGYLLIHFQEPCEVHLFDSSTDVNLTEVKVAVKSGTGFVLLDGLADGNQDFLNELYYTFSQSFNFVGSGAGSLDLKQKACIFDKEGIYENKAIVIFIESKVGLGIKHGYERIAGPIIATSTNASRIHELNWENALDVYAHILHKEADVLVDKSDFFSVSKGYPLGVSYQGHEDIVRDPISCSSEGGINCIDDIPENAALYVLKGEPEKLIQAAKESCSEAMSFGYDNPSHCLLIDCVTRVLFLEDDFNFSCYFVTGRKNIEILVQIIIWNALRKIG